MSVDVASPSYPETARTRAFEYWHRYLYKPYYVHSPKRLVQRFSGDLARSATRLPWGLPISFQAGSIIGTQLVRTGIHDLVLTEALFRLTAPADTCVDVGANIGYTTSLLASQAGVAGRVISFEPAPDTFGLLSRNISSWRGSGIAEIDPRQQAVSHVASTLMLATPTAHSGDSGGRTLEAIDDELEVIPVQSATLDSLGLASIDLLKIDVEGHELSVLQGGDALLQRHAIRDIVFEDQGQPPTRVTDHLAASGYTLFRVEQATGKPRLVVDLVRRVPIYWDAPNYLATVDPDRARERFRSRGWGCLRPHRR